MSQENGSRPAWHHLTSEETARRLEVEPSQGLDPAEAARRLAQRGPNVLAARQKESGLQAFLRQYRDFMQIILLAAAAVNHVFTGDLGTTLLLVGLTVFNAVLGLQQESKAEASLAALQKMLKNIARVRRGNQVVEIDAAGIVPGDIVLIEAGNRVPADGRLIVAATLEIEEAALTGESTPTLKREDAIADEDAGLGDRLSMAYMNTSVTRGRGEFIATGTGMDTEIGRIADLLNKTDADKTPLQRQLDRLTLAIAGLAGIAFLLMIALGARHGQSFETLFITGVALAISAIPTGMPAVVTSLYSIGTRVLAAHNAIVKRLPSVETLGSVSAICSDKTGTLTLNQMTARELTVPGRNRYRITGEGYAIEGKLLHEGGQGVELAEVLLPMALCADARLDGETLIGDPTEGALIVLAAKGGIDVDGARRRYPRVAEVPFDSDYKFMATFHELTDESGRPVIRCFVKGAPDVLIERGGSFWMPGGEAQPIGSEERRRALQENDRMARAGQRVMVVARRDFEPSAFDPHRDLLGSITELTLLGMVGIVDPPRSEAEQAIGACKRAGIRVRMITGDHAVTAAAIGQELGIDGDAMTGAAFAALSDDELRDRLPEIGVVARVAPEDKIRLVRLLQERGEIVAMTGDGVNDAPALKKADIGVAMGITGTEVSKEAAVMILTDDNFATIVKAVDYGRAIYDNLSKYIRFQMTALVAFIASFLGASLLGILAGIPFAPLPILWINFAVQVPIALALGFDSPSPGLLDRKPRPLSRPVLTRGQWLRITFLGLVMTAATLWVEARYEPESAMLAASMGFVAFGLLNIVLGLNSRSETETALGRDIAGDRRQLMLLGTSFLLTLLPIELAFLQRALGLQPIGLDGWLLALALAGGFLLVGEAVKAVLRSVRGRAPEPAPAVP